VRQIADQAKSLLKRSSPGLAKSFKTGYQQVLRKGYGTALKLNGGKPKYLLILGHMRSGSTLLLHLLNSNPAIIGYGETHLHYKTAADLENLLPELAYFFRKTSLPHKYALDKVLHNSFLNDFSLLSREDVYSLFLLRDPIRTMQSLRDLNSLHDPLFDTTTENGCLTYLTERLARLEGMSSAVRPGQSLLVTYEDLVNHTEESFSALEQWLGLTHPLQEAYALHRGSGQWGMGDGTDLIKSKKIQSKARPLPIAVSQSAAELATASYNRCHDTLSRSCETIRATTTAR
jgi:hypothetical protein